MKFENVYLSNIMSEKPWMYYYHCTKNEVFHIKDFFSKCDQIHRKLRIWSHLLKKSLNENFCFGAVHFVSNLNLLNNFILLGIHKNQRRISEPTKHL